MDQGLNHIGVRASDASSDADFTSTGIEAMTVDDESTQFSATDDSLDDATGSAPGNFAETAFDSEPDRDPVGDGSTSETVRHTATYATGEANFTIRRIALHNAGTGSVSETSATLVGGIDNQAITKNSDFTLTIDVDIQYADNSGTNSLVVNQGLQHIGVRASDASSDGEFTSTGIESMAVDDDGNGFSATDDSLDDAGGGAPANVATSDFDSEPSRSGQAVSHLATYGTSEANFNIQRISLHRAAAASVSGTSTTLVAGIDSQSLTKTNDFSVTITVDLTYSDAS